MRKQRGSLYTTTNTCVLHALLLTDDGYLIQDSSSPMPTPGKAFHMPACARALSQCFFWWQQHFLRGLLACSLVAFSDTSQVLTLAMSCKEEEQWAGARRGGGQPRVCVGGGARACVWRRTTSPCQKWWPATITTGSSRGIEKSSEGILYNDDSNMRHGKSWARTCTETCSRAAVVSGGSGTRGFNLASSGSRWCRLTPRRRQTAQPGEAVGEDKRGNFGAMLIMGREQKKCGWSSRPPWGTP